MVDGAQPHFGETVLPDFALKDGSVIGVARVYQSMTYEQLWEPAYAIGDVAVIPATGPFLHKHSVIHSPFLHLSKVHLDAAFFARQTVVWLWRLRRVSARIQGPDVHVGVDHWRLRRNRRSGHRGQQKC